MKIEGVDLASADFWGLPVLMLGIVVCVIAMVFRSVIKSDSDGSSGGFIFFLVAVGATMYVLFMLYTFFQVGN